MVAFELAQVFNSYIHKFSNKNSTFAVIQYTLTLWFIIARIQGVCTIFEKHFRIPFRFKFFDKNWVTRFEIFYNDILIERLFSEFTFAKYFWMQNSIYKTFLRHISLLQNIFLCVCYFICKLFKEILFEWNQFYRLWWNSICKLFLSKILSNILWANYFWV